MDKLLIKQLLFHGSWLVFAAIAWLSWRWRGDSYQRLFNPPTIDVLQLQP